ncbi:MAG: hypothetical protein KDD44_12375, partial [Bdellovibrionales bacterium]|nr:hypothetical protein [Bdellovibrionales bacterium]
YAFAFPLFARAARSDSEHALPISAGGEGQNWVEVSNVSSARVTARMRFYNQAGALVSDASQSIASHAQAHVNANQFIPAGSVGHVAISSTAVGALASASMFYFYAPAGAISAMYGSQPKQTIDSSQLGSYNLFLGMYNFLKLFNPSDAAVNGTIAVHSGASVREITFSLPARAAADFGLHETANYGTSPDSYGLVAVDGAPVVAEVLRLRPSPTSGFDFAFPTPVD